MKPKHKLLISCTSIHDFSKTYQRNPKNLQALSNYIYSQNVLSYMCKSSYNSTNKLDEAFLLDLLF